VKYLDLYKHLLPRGRAWSLIVEKPLRQFFEGLTVVWSDIETYFGLIYFDLFVGTSRALDEWEDQFGFTQELNDEQSREDRLSSAWQASGGQSPRYVQDTLQAAGFDVYVHDWWGPGTNPPVARNPLLYLANGRDEIVYVVECGEPLAECGEPLAQAGESVTPIGFPLVNKISVVQVAGVEAGEPLAEAGEPLAQCGEIFGYAFTTRTYEVPTDPALWPYFVYIGGETFGTPATVDTTRREEFERLCLKICPTQLWIGALISYE
jgi:hypothetical protein